MKPQQRAITAELLQITIALLDQIEDRARKPASLVYTPGSLANLGAIAELARDARGPLRAILPEFKPRRSGWKALIFGGNP